MLFFCFVLSPYLSGQSTYISDLDLRDKINGGLLGQFFGNLNGLEHENKYFEEPGNVDVYVPDLSDGAFTDDDTDIEFVYIYHMVQEDETMLSYPRIKELWKENINTKIWCSNRYARDLMDLGLEPPQTGRIALNPWAIFNISGQFLCEEFALIAPGMPQTAANLGAYYTHVAVDGEPSQTSVLYDAIIASAFFEADMNELIKIGLSAVDPESEIHSIVSNVEKWYQQHPDDWKTTRLSIKEKYWNGQWGSPGGSNGYRTITAATIGALLHGKGDFVETIRLAFNFGWDADNIASMVGTIMGVLKGEQWIRKQGWKIKDIYKNTRRPGLPTDLTITDFSNLHIQLAKKVILENGGVKVTENGREGFRILTQPAKPIEALPEPLHRIQDMRRHWWPILVSALKGTDIERAQAVYVATCLDLVTELAITFPEDWITAIDRFKPHYEKLFKNEQWSIEAKKYFEDVIINKNIDPLCPFDYPTFRQID